MTRDAMIEAMATARMDALKEAAKLAWGMNAKYMRSKYKIEHNRKRYDVYGVDRCENKAANVISEDIHNAILALIPSSAAEPADDIPDTPEQRDFIAAHNEYMRRKYPNMVEIADPLQTESEVLAAALGLFEVSNLIDAAVALHADMIAHADTSIGEDGIERGAIVGASQDVWQMFQSALALVRP